MQYVVRCKECGVISDPLISEAEAELLIKDLEQQDRECEMYIPNSYEVLELFN